jgi:tetratricopeptide (TPR) repeat protein
MRRSNNLGAILHRLKRPHEPFASYWRAYELRPRHADTLNNLGLQLIARHRTDKAIVLLQHALLLRPDSRITVNSLALAYVDFGEYDRAVQCFEQILESDPVAPEVFSNLPAALEEGGNLKRALAHCDFALRLDPNNISVRWNRSLCLLQAGEHERGWAEYECGRHKPDHEMLSFPGPTATARHSTAERCCCTLSRGDATRFSSSDTRAAFRGTEEKLLCRKPLGNPYIQQVRHDICAVTIS